MIKALTGLNRDGRRTVILGVDDRNVMRLCSGQPIRVDGRDMGLDVDILILHGPTYEDILAGLRKAGCEIPEFPLDKPITLRGDELKGNKNS